MILPFPGCLHVYFNEVRNYVQHINKRQKIVFGNKEHTTD